MFSNLRQRKGHYYLRLRVPADLHSIIPEPEVIKSLRTKDRKTARVAAAWMLPGILQALTLARTAFISRSRPQNVWMPFWSGNRKGEGLSQSSRWRPPASIFPLLSAMVTEYINDKKQTPNGTK